MIQNSGFLPDHPQNLTTCSLCCARHTLKISERSVHNFLSYLVHTHRQTKTGKNITSLAEVTILNNNTKSHKNRHKNLQKKCCCNDLTRLSRRVAVERFSAVDWGVQYAVTSCHVCVRVVYNESPADSTLECSAGLSMIYRRAEHCANVKNFLHKDTNVKKT